MSRSAAVQFSVLLIGSIRMLCGQDQPAPRAADSPHIDLVIEREEHGQWKKLDPQTVLDAGNTVRFRVQASFPGYLYAFCRSSDGDGEWLFPLSDSQGGNQIDRDVPYLIPSKTQSYIVSGKAGFDVVYWLISPKPIAGNSWLPPADTAPVPRTMVPRCRDDIDAATTCLDSRAGVAPVTKSGNKSDSFAPGGLKPRELRLSPDSGNTRIEAVNGPGLFIYEFRIAHR